MSQSRINWRYLEREEYLLAKKRASELFDFLKPWLQFPFPGGLRPDAPEECKELYEAIALRVGKSFITECWWKILPSVASLAVWGVHRFRMATRV